MSSNEYLDHRETTVYQLQTNNEAKHNYALIVDWNNPVSYSIAAHLENNISLGSV